MVYTLYKYQEIGGTYRIGKKLGTRDQLPLIKKGWEENAKIRYNLTEEQSEAIIEPFLQCILDATRYSFSLVHSLS